jgi:Cu(I)/Ag(I) efflux system periplasmic protein CusF
MNDRLFAALLALFLPAGAAVAAPPVPAARSDAMVIAQASTAMTEGEVRKVDKGSGKITLKHAEIRNLDMPAMTMVFQVKDAALLDRVKQGDKVRFHAEKVNDVMVVTAIEPAK